MLHAQVVRSTRPSARILADRHERRRGRARRAVRAHRPRRPAQRPLQRRAGPDDGGGPAPRPHPGARRRDRALPRRGRRAGGRRDRGGRRGGARAASPSSTRTCPASSTPRRPCAPTRPGSSRPATSSRAGRSARATSRPASARRTSSSSGRYRTPLHRPRLHRARGRRRLARRERRHHDPRGDPGHRALPGRRQRPRPAPLPGADHRAVHRRRLRRQGGRDGRGVPRPPGLEDHAAGPPLLLARGVDPLADQAAPVRHEVHARRPAGRHARRARGRADLGRRRLRVPVAAHAPLRDGPRRRAVPHPPRPGGRRLRPDEQPADLGLPGLRLGAAGLRLREPDGRAGPGARAGSRWSSASGTTSAKGERLASGQELETAVWLPETARRAWDALGPRRRAVGTRQARGPGPRVGAHVLRADRLAPRLGERVGGAPDGRHGPDPDRRPRHRRRPGGLAGPDHGGAARACPSRTSPSTSATRR